MGRANTLSSSKTIFQGTTIYHNDASSSSSSTRRSMTEMVQDVNSGDTPLTYLEKKEADSVGVLTDELLVSTMSSLPRPIFDAIENTISTAAIAVDEESVSPTSPPLTFPKFLTMQVLLFFMIIACFLVFAIVVVVRYFGFCMAAWEYFFIGCPRCLLVCSVVGIALCVCLFFVDARKKMHKLILFLSFCVLLPLFLVGVLLYVYFCCNNCYRGGCFSFITWSCYRANGSPSPFGIRPTRG